MESLAHQNFFLGLNFPNFDWIMGDFLFWNFKWRHHKIVNAAPLGGKVISFIFHCSRPHEFSIWAQTHISCLHERVCHWRKIYIPDRGKFIPPRCVASRHEKLFPRVWKAIFVLFQFQIFYFLFLLLVFLTYFGNFRASCVQKEPFGNLIFTEQFGLNKLI